MKKIAFLFLALLLSVSGVMAQGNTTNDSFNRAKKMLAREVYVSPEHRASVYCNVPFDDKLRIETLPDGFILSGNVKRAHRIEWEHAVPAENFGRAFVEWREGDPHCVDNRGKSFKGRKCAEKVNMIYRYMQSDMHNLFPAVGAVNASRSNFRYAELPVNAPSTFGPACAAKLQDNRFEPPDSAKGTVARASLYMDDAYPAFSLSDQQKKLFRVWNDKFPPDEWECERNRRIGKLQGNDNPFVTEKCK